MSTLDATDLRILSLLWGTLGGGFPCSGGYVIRRLIVKGFVILQAINCNYCCSEVKHRRCERIQTGVLSACAWAKRRTPGTRWSTKLSSERATEQATCLFSVCLCFCRPFRAFFVVALLPGVVTPVCVLSSLRDFLPMPLCWLSSETLWNKCLKVSGINKPRTAKISNALNNNSHYKCANSILPDCKSGRTGGMEAECGLILLKIHDIIFIISRGKWRLSVPRCKMLRAVWADSPRCVGSNSTLCCPFLYVEKTSKLCWCCLFLQGCRYFLYFVSEIGLL